MVDYITLCSVQYSVYLVFSEYSVYSLYSVYPLYAVYIRYFQNIRYQIIVLFITGQTAMEVAQARGHLQVELMLLKMMMMRRKVMMMMMVIMMRKMKMMIAQVSELIKSSLEQRDKPDEV